MRVTTFASGSTGNCTLISAEDTNILIDAGISMRRIKGCLAACGLTAKDISAVLITHEHRDHISGIATMTKYHHLPIYATAAAASAVRAIPGTDECMTEIKPGESFEVGGICATPFRTMHDTPESVGYTLQADVRFGFCTDLGEVTPEVLQGLDGCKAAVIESNHDLEMLRYGSYPYFLKKRILSPRGHLSNDESGKLAAWLCRHGTKSIMLAHLSRENNSPALAKQTVELSLGNEGLTPGRDIELFVAPEAEARTMILETGAQCWA